VRVNGGKQGRLPGISDRDLHAAPVVAGCAAGDDSCLLHPGDQSVDPANPWAIFRAYLDGIAAQAASAVVPNWIDRLGGADVYTLSNAYQLAESLRIDYGQLGPFGIHP